MGKTAAHRLSEHVVALGRPLRPAERRTIERMLRGLLSWQASLRVFPRVLRAPDATPYVSTYAHGKLRGCYGSHEGKPGERIVRAFLRALTDRRYGGTAPDERAELAAEVAYVTRAEPMRADEAAARIEAGTHGVARIDDGVATALLPSVARERGYDGVGFLDLLAKKAGKPRSDEGIVWLLEIEEVSSHGARDASPARAAKRWLEALVDASGQVAYDMDPGTGTLRHDGTMRHGRIAVAIEALASFGSPRTKRAREWLAHEIDVGLSRGAHGWPDRKDMVLGTLALAARAGVETPLEEVARAIDVATCSPWHAAQAASVLGRKTPQPLWDACVRSLEGRPFSPYALMAAQARGEGAIVERCVRAIIASIRARAPYEGGANVAKVPETALTAVAAEALAPLASPEAKRANRLARSFVLAQQVLEVPASMHPRALGAFRASPIAPVLRCDIAGHAILATLA